MSASERAEARRRAILSRGSDRLAKLTTSARGDDPVYKLNDPPLPTIPTPSRNFVGEESAMPTPPKRPSPSPRASVESEPVNPFAPFAAGGVPDPSVWTEQQQQILQALMSGNRSPESLPGLTPTDVDPSLPPMDNPFAAMLAGGGAFSPFPTPVAGASGKAPAAEAPPPPTKLQKMMPFMHLLTTWCLLAYFVLYMEPRLHSETARNLDSLGAGGLWRRWAELGRANGLGEIALILRIQVLVGSRCCFPYNRPMLTRV
ncbi:hypothetical protein H0H87_006157 [Tephrocybe sp. NHM501043]|nr:hypothetical protein H0H87_006157 [Tephrocybe sp. NHM501043]